MIMCLQMVVWCKSVVEIRKSLCYGCSVHSHTHTLSLLLFLKACWQALHTHTHTHVRSLLEIRIRYSAGSYINTTHTCGRRLGSQQPLLLCVISLVCYYRPRLCVCVCAHSHMGVSPQMSNYSNKSDSHPQILNNNKNNYTPTKT